MQDAENPLTIQVVDADSKLADRITLRIQNSSTEFVNALRRSVLDDVQTLAIDEVSVSRNDSPLSDEMIANRLGQIPFICPYSVLQKYKTTYECKCTSRCQTCSIQFRLHVRNESLTEPRIVTSDDLEAVDRIGPEIGMPLDVWPLGKGGRGGGPIIITKLPPCTKGEQDSVSFPSIDLDAVVMKNCGIVHAKWIPGLASFQPIPRITISPIAQSYEKAIALLAKEESVCPRGVFELRRVGQQERVAVSKDGEEKCILCGECTSVVRMESAIPEQLVAEARQLGSEPRVVTVVPSTTDFLFKIESHGALPASDILIEALTCLKHRVAETRWAIDKHNNSADSFN